ncbi:MAG: chain length determinant protein EpsF [Burkholderiales bacterium]
MSLSQFLSIIRAHWRVVAMVLMLTVGTAVSISLMLPKQYIATATVVIDQSRPDPVAAAMYQGNPSPAFMATQVDVIKSERVAMRVIRQLNLAESEGIKADWARATKGEGSLEAWLVQRLLFALDIKPSRESNVVGVSYKADDRDRAALMANAFVQAYLDVSLELKVGPAKDYSGFFEGRSKDLRANVERAQAKLSAYQREKGVVVATDGQIDVESARLNELSTQLVAVQGMAAGANGRQAQVQSGGGERLAEVINNPIVSGLRAEVTKAEARLQELTSRLGDNHPQVIEARANINSLRGRLDVETRRIAGTVGAAGSINRQREAELRAAVEAQRARVLKMRLAREEGMVLVRDLENAQRAYDAVLTRLNQSSLESQVTQPNAYVLAQAMPPLLPSSPKIITNTVLSIVIGMVLAIGAAIVLEMIDRRLRNVDEVSELLGLPVLGVLPKPGGVGGFSGGRLSIESPRGLFGYLPAPRKEA